MSIFVDIHEQCKPLFDGRDDSNPILDAINRLSEEDRAQWRKEAAYFESLLPSLADEEDACEAAKPLLIAKFG